MKRSELRKIIKEEMNILNEGVIPISKVKTAIKKDRLVYYKESMDEKEYQDFLKVGIKKFNKELNTIKDYRDAVNFLRTGSFMDDEEAMELLLGILI